MHLILKKDNYLPVINGGYAHTRSFAKGCRFEVLKKCKTHFILRHGEFVVFATRVRANKVFDEIEKEIVIGQPRWELKDDNREG